jgi:adenosylcobinamide-GDP ribazoletransferase
MRQTSAPSTGPGNRAIHQLRLFFIALQFFTRLPVPRWVGFQADWLSHASRYFPLVGIVVGATAAAVYGAAVWVWPPALAVLLSTAAGIYLTGAFHEDGFADTCDGLGGDVSPERALDIMKDSRIGTYGAVGIGLMLALKCTALALLPPQAVVAALLAAHPLSRLAACALIWQLDYVKAAGKAKPLAQQMSNIEFLVAALPVLLVTGGLLLAGWLAWQHLAAGIVAVILVATWLAKKFIARLGGYTGDCLGAVQQATELGFYLAVLAAAR